VDRCEAPTGQGCARPKRRFPPTVRLGPGPCRLGPQQSLPCACSNPGRFARPIRCSRVPQPVLFGPAMSRLPAIPARARSPDMQRSARLITPAHNSGCRARGRRASMPEAPCPSESLSSPSPYLVRVSAASVRRPEGPAARCRTCSPSGPRCVPPGHGPGPLEAQPARPAERRREERRGPARAGTGRRRRPPTRTGR
jgi:hypothetical protein